ncbi:hypothetical protein [Actinopolyspora lacussalsi]|uniref:hypothetical protein n=1 Tax=Actinopolyspora righensis TaxID=995060 RepID=UPI003CCBABE0
MRTNGFVRISPDFAPARLAVVLTGGGESRDTTGVLPRLAARLDRGGAGAGLWRSRTRRTSRRVLRAVAAAFRGDGHGECVAAPFPGSFPDSGCAGRRDRMGAARQRPGANGEGRRAGPVQMNFALASMPENAVQWHTSIG